MARVDHYLFIDDLQCDQEHQLELLVSVNQEWKSEDGESLDSMTICLDSNLTEALDAMFLMTDHDLDVFSAEQIEESIHTLHVLEQQAKELKDHLSHQLKKKKERN